MSCIFDFDKNAYSAAKACFWGGIAVHLFALTNVMPNYDDIAAYPIGFGTGISSGRWFLEILNRFLIKNGLAFNLTYVNGALFLLLLSLAALLTASVLKIKSRRLCVLIGISYAVFPTATSILFFRFTSHIYGLAILLSAAAVYFYFRGFRGAFLLSAVCISLSLGIYQAYFPLTVALFLLVLVLRILDEPAAAFRQNLKTCLCVLGTMLLGVIIYILLLKVCLRYYGVELSGYQGIGDASAYSLAALPALLKDTVLPVLLLPVRDYCGISETAYLKFMYLLLALLAVYLLYANIRRTGLGAGNILLVVLLCALMSVAVNLIVLMAPKSTVYTMMVYGFVVLLWIPLTLAERMPEREKTGKPAWSGKASAILVGLVLLCYAYFANANYASMHFAARQTENYLNALTIRVMSTEGYDTDKRWALMGEINDPLLEDRWRLANRYGGNTTGVELINSYSRTEWIRVYFGYYLPLVSEEEKTALKATEEYRQMPEWPNDGSIRVIDDIVVVKFSEDETAVQP